MMKSRLYKLNSLTHNELNTNIDNVIKGTYTRTEQANIIRNLQIEEKIKGLSIKSRHFKCATV